MNHSRIELKVCEACGALWLRAGCPALGSDSMGQATSRNVYCKPCVRMLADFPATRGPKKASRIRVRIRPRKTAIAATVANAQAGAR